RHARRGRRCRGRREGGAAPALPAAGWGGGGGSAETEARVLKPEMCVPVPRLSREPKAIHVATRAVFLKGEKHFVYVEPMPGRFLRREVRVGREHDGRMVVLAGLESGERVVSSGCLLLEQLLQSNG